MNIFITGATGFIGANLAHKLANEGHTVHALVRTPSKASLLQHERILLFEGDLSNKENIAAAMATCDQVYHLAAFAQVWDKDPNTFHRINVDGCILIMEQALLAGVKRMVLTSTAGVFGPAVDGKPVSEDTPRKLPFFTEYESTKAEAEVVAQKYLPKGLEVVIVNPTRVYGPGFLSKSNAVTMMVKQYIIGKWKLLPGDGSKTGNYVYVDDVVQGHLLAMEKGRSGERYILGGSNVSYTQIFDSVKKISKKAYPLYKIPLFAMLFFARIQLFMATVFGKTPVITPKWVRRYLYDWSNSSQKAVKELGYRPTPIDDGLKLTIDWLQNENN